MINGIYDDYIYIWYISFQYIYGIYPINGIPPYHKWSTIDDIRWYMLYIYTYIWLTPPIWEWFIETIYGEMMINDDD